MAQMPSPSEWADLVDEYLGFLRPQGYRLVVVKDEPELAAWGPRVRYLGSKSGVQVHWSVEFVRVDTFVMELVDGQVPEYPIFIHDGDPIRYFHLDNLLEAIDPDRGRQASALSGLEPDAVRRQLTFVADSIRDLGGELLDPTSEAFARATARIHESVRRDPPEVTIYVPEGTSDREAARMAKKSKSLFPKVGVVVRRYITGRRP
jgi:hypothetical protein